MEHVVTAVHLDELMRYPRNPKDHDIGGIVESLGRFGYVAPIIVNRSTSMILAGHGRLDSLWEMFNADPDAPPIRVEDDGGRWSVPVIMVDVPEDQHEAYVVADNRHTERGGWNESMLHDVLADLASRDELAGTGFDGDDVDELAARLNLTDFIDGDGVEGGGSNLSRVHGPGTHGEVIRLECGEIMTTIHRDLHDRLWAHLQPHEDRRDAITAVIEAGLAACSGSE